MLFVAKTVFEQQEKKEIDPNELDGFSTISEIVDLCKQIQETTDFKEQKRLKQKLPVLLASGRYLWLDADGNNHVDGNQDPIDFHWVASQIPHALWFVSPSGKGMKILIELNRDIDEDELPSVKAYLCSTITKLIGLGIDKDSRMDIAYVSDSEVHFSNQIFQIPDVLEKVADQKKIFDYDRGSVSDELFKLVEILRDFPDRTTYKKWLGLVYAALSRYGTDAIPLLESKWFGERYDVLLKYAIGKDSGYLDALWNSRIVKNETFDRKRQHERRIWAGATGAGKSNNAADQILKVFTEPEDVFMQYVIYVVPSVEQAVAFAKKLIDRGITYEILVGKDTYEKAKGGEQAQLSMRSGKDTMVKIIQLASLMTGSYYQHVKSENRRLNHIYIDELTITDFVRPSLAKSTIPRAFLGIHTDDDIHALYEKRYRADYKYAKFLMEEGSSSHFVSSILFQGADTTVLTTEELTIACLEQLDFARTDIKKEATEALAETCSLHVSVSDDYIQKFVQDKSFKSLIKEHGFENVFANKSEFATGNLMTIKGQHLTGKNLTVIRCLPQHVTAAIAELYTSCFNNTEIDPVALYYKDSMMQAVGRSVGFRGWTEGWVLVHSRVWNIIKDLKYIFKIRDWSVTIDPEFRRSRQKLKDAYNERDAQRAKFWKSDKIAKINARMTYTGDPKDIITKDTLKGMLMKGVTLNDVAEAFNVPKGKGNKGFFIKEIKFIV